MSKEYCEHCGCPKEVCCIDRAVKEIEQEMILHLNNAEAAGEPVCSCMIEGERDCETMYMLKQLKKKLRKEQG